MRLLRTVLFPVLLLLGLVACSSGSSGSDDAGSEAGGAADADSAEYSQADDGEGGTREVVTTGSLSLVAADPRAAMDEIVLAAEGVGGRVEERSEQSATDREEARGWLTVRIPAAEVTGVLDSIEALGETTDVSITSEDVTRQGRDLDARIAALQASTDRLLTLMTEAESNEALFAAEDALSQRQSDLESLQSERALLSEQVAMSSLHISVSAEPTAQLEAAGFLGGLESGWGALVGFAGGLLVALGAVLPWLVAVGVPAAVVVVLVRRRRRRVQPQPEPAPA